MMEWEAMKEVITYGKSLNTQIHLVMVDTVNRNFSGEENSSKDVAKAYKHLDKVKEAFDCSIAMVHHTGKSGTIIRGSAAWVQNVDASYEMKRQGKTFYTTFIPHKMKDAALGDEMNFEMKEVILKRKGRGHVEDTVLTTLITNRIDEIPAPERTRRKEGGITYTILKCLEDKGVATTKKEIEDYAFENGQAIDSIKTSLVRMVKSGEIVRVKPGVYELPPLTK
jgi:hypothetical protein